MHDLNYKPIVWKKYFDEFSKRNQPIKIFNRPDGSLTNW